MFLLHIHGFWLDNVRPPGTSVDGLLVRVMGFGGAGVDIFIVLSGFCLTLPLLTREAEVRGMSTRKFFARRAYRLLPAYYAALILVMSIELVPALRRQLVARDLSWWDALTHGTLTFPLFGDTLGSVNGSLWSISLELTLYLGFPLLLLFHRWGGMRAVLAVTVGLAIIWWGFTLWWTKSSSFPDYLPEPDKLFPARWCQFAMGMGAAILVRRNPSGLRRWSLATMVIALPMGLFGYSQGQPIANQLGWGLVGAALLCLLSTIDNRRFALGPLAWLSGLGVISYSFYLLHQPILLLTSGIAKDKGLPIGVTVLLALAIAGTITVLMAAVFYRFVEKPFLVRGSMRDAVLPEPAKHRAPLAPQ